MKPCYRCKINKSLNDFYRDKKQHDGYNMYCKPCVNKFNTDAYQAKKQGARFCRRCEKYKSFVEFDGTHRNTCITCVKYELNKTTQVCSKCKKEKNKNKFAPSNRYISGYTTSCKACWYIAERRDAARIKKRADKHKQWARDNPDIVNALNRNRKQRKRRAAGIASIEQIAARIEVWGYRCWLNQMHPYQAIDHVIPLSKGGTGWPANLRPICKSCNSSKNNKHPLYEKILPYQAQASL